MKKSELVFTAILLPIDFVLAVTAAVTAYSLRFGSFAAFRPATATILYATYVNYSFLFALVFVLCFAIAGLYTISGPRQLKLEISKVVLASSTAMMAVVVLIFFKGQLFASRFIILAAWVLAVVFIALGRIITRLVQRQLITYGIGVHRAILIGKNDNTMQRFLHDFADKPIIGHMVVASFPNFTADVVAAIDALRDDQHIDEIIVTDTSLDRDTLSAVLGFAQSRQLGFKYSADLLETHAKNVEISTLVGTPIIEIKATRLDGWGRIYKRVFDIIVSAIAIVVTAPIMLCVAIAIKLDSAGPVFTSRVGDDGAFLTRVGQNSTPFHYFKFRSMIVGASKMLKHLSHLDERKDGPLFKMKDDPRVTRVGKFIRKTSLDHLPELFLVFIGSMSLVGPRPHLPEEVAHYQDRHRRVFMVKPGMTGLPQVSGRADLSFEEEVRLDTFYIENWSPWMDIATLIKTPLIVFMKKGAY